MLEKIRKWQGMDWLLVGGMALLVLGVGMNLNRREGGGAKIELVKRAVTPTMVGGEVVVDVEGEVIRPGVYRLRVGSRVAEVLVLAGGLAVGADRNWVEGNINRAEKVRDGMKIFIPKKEPGTKTAGVGLTGQRVLGTSQGVINLNTATIEELDKLPGVGPSLGQKIIDYREKNGGFKNPEEVKLVSGIGEKMWEKIKDQIGI